MTKVSRTPSFMQKTDPCYNVNTRRGHLQENAQKYPTNDIYSAYHGKIMTFIGRNEDNHQKKYFSATVLCSILDLLSNHFSIYIKTLFHLPKRLWL